MQENITNADMIDKKALDDALIEYMFTVQALDYAYITLVLKDFEDFYTCPWLREEYIEMREIDGIEYEVRACWTDFTMFMTFTNDERFRFYMLTHLEDPDDTSVEAYRKADKKYILKPLDEDDFPNY